MTTAPSPMRPGFRFVTHDVADAAKLYCDAGIDVSIRPLGDRAGRIELSSTRGLVEGVNFARAAFDEPVEIVPHQGFEAFELLMPVRGSTEVMLGGRTMTVAGRCAAILDMREMQSLKRSPASENCGIFIDKAVLTGRLFALTGAPVTRALEFTPELDMAQPSAAALRDFLLGLEQAGILPALGDAPQSRERLAALVADMVLELLPHNYRAALQRVPGMIAPRHVKRTIDYIHANAESGFGSEDLVRISGVSLRALQYGFRKFLDTSISEYERSVRLDRARRDIEADPGRRIAVVCERWGFSNVTRFNRQFEAAFGVSAVTMRKALLQR